MHLRSLLRPALRAACALALAAPAFAPRAEAQFNQKWLSAGSLHNWYSEIGSEIEEGFVKQQQYGFRWPGVYTVTDMQAAKGFWIGARNVRGPEGTTFSTRVVHVGPRVSGAGEFFPARFEMVARYAPPLVFVDGDPSIPDAAMSNDRVDEAADADRSIESEVNTLLGITVRRKILQFSNEYHDNYHVIEYTFTNTGNTDSDAEIEVPGQTLQDVVFHWQWRWSVARETRVLVGNPTGWGKNTMLDARGDGLAGVYGDLPSENFRAMFAWHGYFPDKTLSYNNIGGPILREGIPSAPIASSDTLGRLGASQFVGTVTLHADTAPGNTADNPAQPRFMNYYDSDEPFLSANDPFTESKMEREYGIMTTDAQDRHGFRAAGSTNRADLTKQKADPAFSKSGGNSAAMGYGPYTLAPGQSVRIVVAEAAAGLSREANETVGRAYKTAVRGLAGPARDDDAPILPITINGTTGLTKNQWVFTGRDSLFQTFRRALANYNSDYGAARAPLPPKEFNVGSGGDRIALTWDVYAGEAPEKFEIYRAQSDYDEPYQLLASVAGSERTYNDQAATRGISYYYYIQAVKGTTTGNDGVPAGRPLRSSRYYTQTYQPAQLQRPQGTALDAVRIVPNPFYLGAVGGARATDSPRYFDQTDKLGLLNIPGQCRIEFFTELGERIASIDHRNGSGDEFWNLTTSSGQVVVSGVYIAVITVTDDIPAEEDVVDAETGTVLVPKGELIFRRGETTYRKFVIIR